MLVQWMPYLRIDYGFNKPKSLQIGKARFLADSDETWRNATGLPRPDYLRMFRDFPTVPQGEVGDPIHGTLIVCEDEEWLARHADAAVAILY